MFSNRSRQATALMLATSMVFFAVAAPAMATETGTLRGRVLQADGITPRTGVVVSLLDSGKREVYASEPTNDEGVFRIDSAPPGSYRLLAEAPEGGFLAPEPVAVQAGANAPLALAMHVAAPDETAGGSGAVAAPDPAMDLWLRILIIGSLGVASFAAFDHVTDQSSGSGFEPPAQGTTGTPTP